MADISSKTNFSDVIEKVQKLLALSKSNNINEANAAMRAANKLIDQYRLEMADIENHVPESQEPIEVDPVPVYSTGRVIPWRMVLLSTLVRHYGVAHFIEPDYTTKRKHSNFKLVGRRSDIQIVKYLFSYLSLECERLALMQRGMGKVFIFNYQEGFVQGIEAQLRESRQECNKNFDTSAIQKIDSRGTEAKNKMWELIPSLKKTPYKGKSQLDHSGREAGFQKGKNTHLGGSVEPGIGTKLLGK